MAIETITYEDAIAVADSDTAADPHGPFAAFYVGTTGDVTVTTLRGRKALFKNVPQGTTIRVAIQRVWTTGTGTPSTILGLMQLPYKGK